MDSRHLLAGFSFQKGFNIFQMGDDEERGHSRPLPTRGKKEETNH